MDSNSIKHLNGSNYNQNHFNGSSSSAKSKTGQHCNKKSMNNEITTPSEGFYESLVTQLAKLSSDLVERRAKITSTCHPQCRILEEKQSWKFVEVLHKCAGIHLKHSSDYHQFYVECLECTNWMKNELTKHGQYLADAQTSKHFGEQELNNFLENTKELCKTLSYWRLKLMELKGKAEILVPIKLRTQVLKDTRPIRCLHDYENAQGELKEDEDLTLLDNTNNNMWKVRSQHGDEFYVPSSFLTILGPDPEALSEAARLVDTYGELWTVLRGLARKALINLVCNLLEACAGFDEQSWMSMPQDKVEKILTIIKLLEEMFGPSWCAQQPGMKDRVEKLKELLSKSLNGEKNLPENKELLRRMLVKNPDLIQDLLKLFQDSWSDKNRFWAQKVNNVCRAVEKFEEDQEFEAVYAIEEVYKLTRAKETTEASHLTTSEQEEKQTFIITGVVNPKNKKIISLDEAISLGIINQKEGKYIGGGETFQQIPIPEAMNESLIKVEFTKRQVSQEKKNDFGFITIKSYMETRPYTIKLVVDPENRSQMNLDEAVKKGVIDQKKNVYRNPKTKSQMTFEEALEKNLLIVDFAEEVKEEQSKEQEVISYAVYSALDTRSGQWLNFKRAVELGLLNPEEGTYVDRTSKHQFKLVEAIEKGLIKAAKVTDPKTIELLPLAEGGLH